MEKEGSKEETVCENTDISIAGEKRVRCRSGQVCRAGDDLRMWSWWA